MKLFMTAGELMDHPSGDTDYHEPMSENFTGLFEEKLEESIHGPETGTHGFHAFDGEETLYNSVKKHGVKNPVEISYSGDKEMLTDGHHRVAAAYDINPQMFIPVTYEDNPFIPSGSWDNVSSRKGS
jgi:hypothetical protein